MTHWMRFVASLLFFTFALAGAALPPPCRIGYSSPRSYDRGLGLRVAVQTGDFDGDGLPDIASLHRYSNDGTPNRTGTLLLNRGHGAFEQKPIIAAGDFGTLQARDLDNDGRLDLVLGGSTPLTVLYGNGDGTLRFGASADVTNVTAIAVGQFDGRNGLDIAVSQSLPAALTILVANPNGTYSQSASYAFTNPVTSVASTDFDGDGRADLIVADRQFVTPFFGNGDGTFTRSTSLPTLVTLSLTTGDVDRDGRPDIIAGGQQVVTTFVYAGSRQFRLNQTHATALEANTIAFTDVDHDAFPDLVLVGNGDVAILHGTAGAGFGLPVSYVVGANAIAGAIGDFNADGLNDVVVSNLASADISILQNLGGGTLDAMLRLDAGSRPIAFAAADVNNDQLRDLIVANQVSGDITVFHQTPTGFEAPVGFSLGFSPKSIKSGDVDGDGNPDIVALSSDGNTVGILFGASSGVFHDLTTLSFGPSLCCIELADMNGDKRDDLVYAEEQGTLGVRFSTFSSFGIPTTYSLQPGVTAIAVGDLDNDTDHDVVAATDQTIFTFRGSPSGALTPSTTLTDIKGTSALAVAPMNADSFGDIIVATTEVTILFGDISSTYMNRTHLGAPADKVTALSIADLNTDGLLDIAATLTRTPASEHFATTFLNRGFDFEAQPAVQTETNPIAILAASLTPNDNLPDLVIAASGKALFATARCAPPAVTVGVASPRSPLPGQPITLVANAVAGAGREATFSFVVDGATVPGTIVNPFEPGVAHATVTLGAGTHTVSAIALYPEGEGAASETVTFVVVGGKRRAVKH